MKSLLTRLRHWLLGLSVLAGLYQPARRRLFGEMRAFVRGLPAALTGPLPERLAALTPAAADLALPADQVRALADAAALFERGTGLGLCLRRSLVRYHYLRRAGMPLHIQIGARLQPGAAAAQAVAGHAWVTLTGAPYFEDDEDWRGYAVMLTWPPTAP